MNNKEVKINGSNLFLALVLLSCLFLLPFSFALTPSGGSFTYGNSSTAAEDAAASNAALAGNVTELTVSGYTTTQTWQGYFGNITGVIQLADGSDNVMYNWTLASPRGEIYATTNQTVYWTNVECFNYTATGALTNENGNGGTTSLYGLNLTTAEARFGINDSDVDGLNETFSLSGAGTHDLFYTANQQFSAGKCKNTRIFDSSGVGVNDHFEEVLLYEPKSTSILFTSLLNQDQNGFDSKTHDFEMLVLENGHGTDIATTSYYFFVELQ